MRLGLKLNFFLISFGLLGPVLNAQSYQGVGVQVVNSLLLDSTALENVHLVMNLEVANIKGEKEKQDLVFTRFGNSWNLTNDAFEIIGNEKYYLVMDHGEQVAYLTEEEAGLSSTRIAGKPITENAILDDVSGAVVHFSVNYDSVFTSVRYAVDTVLMVLKEVRISFKEGNEEGLASQTIRYTTFEKLDSDRRIKKLETCITVYKKKANLLAPYSDYLFYDNRREP